MALPLYGRKSVFPALFIACGFFLSAGCGEIQHLTRPDTPENLRAVFTEDIFGTDGVRLTWDDVNRSNDIGFKIFKDGEYLLSLEPDCFYDESDVLSCTPINSPSYFDTAVSRGETHCYAVSSHYVDDPIFGDSELAQVCMHIPMEGFTGRPVTPPTSSARSPSPEARP